MSETKHTLKNKMAAPVYVACRQSRQSPGLIFNLFVLLCFTSYLTQCALSLLVYDKSTLLSLQPSANDLLFQARNGSHHSPPPFLMSIPGYLRRWPVVPYRRGSVGNGAEDEVALPLS